MPFRPHWLSQGYEDLIAVVDENRRQGAADDFDVVIVGSGYGGAVAAARLACATRSDGTPLRVCVLERGCEYLPGTFPRRFADLPGHVRFSRGDHPGPQGRRDGLFDIRIGSDVSALVGNGLGGGSLINASVAERADNDVFEDPAWPAALRRDLGELKDCYGRAEKMLEVVKAPADHFAKYRALERLGRDLGLPQARPARVARHFQRPAPEQERASELQASGNDREGKVNEHGVPQRPCIECGDCVTGCNVWAKNTLPMNYLARAWRGGAELYTNVTVSRIARDAARDHWYVWCAPTEKQHPPAKPRKVRAAHVILAAGSFGSTEILMRSRSRRLRFSARLGERFSTNGDMISVLYGQRDAVNAAPEESTPLGDRHVGPTITGVIETQGTRDERVLIEELAIPGALRRIFEEVVTTGALPVQLGRFDRSRHRSRGPDPAAVDPDKVCRSQVFAAMGDDGAAGRLVMAAGWEKTDGDGAICVDWPTAADAGVFQRQDKILSRGGEGEALYLRNPLWKPLPEKLTALFSGRKPSGKLFTVHPLGGCPMADDVEHGVVDDLGRVFEPPDPGDPQQRGNVARTHDGLLVLDGSIVPVALGVNPLLTIAALAERAVARYAVLREWTLDAQKKLRDIPGLPAGIRSPTDAKPRQSRQAPPPATAVRFAETMTHEFEAAPGEKKRRKLVLDVTFDDIPDLPKFLRTAPHEVKIAAGAAVLRLLEDDREVAGAPLKGTVSWMERGETRFLSRTIGTAITWIRMRALADLFQRYREQGLKGVLGLIGNGAGAIAVCSNAGEVRYLRYNLTLTADFKTELGELKAGTQIQGLKTFQYAGGGNPWRQLSELAVRRGDTGGGILGASTLKVDFEEFFRRFAVQLQITKQRDQPSAIMDLASLALFVARIIFKAHFWSFRLPEYEKYDAGRARRRLPQPLANLGFQRVKVRVEPEQEPGEAHKEPLSLLLTRYWKDKPDPQKKNPVLLLHGFGASGAQFAHAALGRNLVQHLVEDGGFDVWVAELRTSIALASSYNQWTLDEVAKEDIPALVEQVLKCTGAAELDVVAHCIGSAMFCTAALAGKLRNRVRSAVLLQVGPLITLSAGNRVRGRMAAALRRYMLTDRVDSTVDDTADWMNAIIDRVLSTYPYDDTEAKAHRLWPPCEPKTHLANCNRSAAVFGRLFQHQNLEAPRERWTSRLARLVRGGKTPESILDRLGDLLGHTNLTTFEQTVHYAFLERLTDCDATNIYISDENIRNRFNFPVYFLHGEKNDVFDPKTTERSAKLLRDVLGEKHRVKHKVIPGYGHLDPLVGNKAHLDVFPLISAFLKDPGEKLSPAEIGRQIDRPKRIIKRPLIGPVLGWLEHDRGTNARTARIWCRTDDEQSFGYFLIATVLKGAKRKPVSAYKAPLVTVKPWPEKDPTKPVVYDAFDLIGEVDLLGVIDVPLPPEQEDYEIVIVSAHADAGADSQDAPRQLRPASVPVDEVLGGVALDAAELDLGALRKARPRSTDELPPPYAELVARLRKRWEAGVEAGRAARHVSDSGYEECPDSVIVSSRLLEATAPGRDSIRFAVASCRFSASRVDREQADAMFGRLRDLLDGPAALAEPPSLLLLAGDQIYADATAGMFDPKSRRERFNDSYREVWTAPNAREVLRRIPTYMMLDDHEVDDNWHPKDRFEDKKAMDWGLTAVREYQLAHSPRREYLRAHSPGGNPDAPPYHYGFESGGFGFFVCDTRTTREGRSRIMDARQFSELQKWLRMCRDADGDRPKFVVSPSVLVPFLSATGGLPRYAPRSDGWDGFPDSLAELVAFIADEDVSNVVFLCGDPHISMVSAIEVERRGGAPLRGACIVASPLYAPFPFANADPREYLAKGALDVGRGRRIRYELQQFADPNGAAAGSADPQTCVVGDSYALVGARRRGARWEVGVEVHLGKEAKRVATVKLG